jgi:putative nucleotidyltransferase with HDIG domain
VYGWTVVGVGFLVVGESLLRLYLTPLEPQWFLLAFLTLISGSASVYLPWAHVSISVSEAFTFTAVLLYGAEAGTLTVALDGLVLSFWVAKRKPEVERALFNIAAATTSAWCSAKLFFKISGIAPLSGTSPATGPALDQILPALLIFAITWFLINSWLIAFIIAFEKRQNPWRVWRNGFIWLSLNYFCGASVSILLIGYNRTIDLRFVGVIVPLLLVLYFTFKTSTDRVADANRHVDQLNSLYLSTIETLAMAIDAKDQITHGHIRRVQTYAVGLARAVGVTDPLLIKAIEAAALLHDMGKLAVPEYILNKPGKLTPVEFEKMKLHVTVGADILSAIDFPYPVVPIVRHHHENWDGSGYPSGLKGTEIPIGARILSVVDCFDALTSDRPYRPRLSDEEAIAILIERRGIMYDPLMVDTFVRVYDHIGPNGESGHVARGVLAEITSFVHNDDRQPRSALDNIAASSDETLTLFELTSDLAGQSSSDESLRVVNRHLRRLIPFSLCVFFSYDRESDELHATYASGDVSSDVKGMRIALGQRLSGWVAANRQTIANSDPVLDLGGVARVPHPRLRSCLSTPVVSGSDLVGVLSVYSSTAAAFSENHKRVIEDIAKRIGMSARRSSDPTPSPAQEALPEVVSVGSLDQVPAFAEDCLTEPDSAFLFIEIADYGHIEQVYGQASAQMVQTFVVEHVRSNLHAGDRLFRYGACEFVAVLRNADRIDVHMIADRIRSLVRGRPVRLTDGSFVAVGLFATVLSGPLDAAALDRVRGSARPQREQVRTSEPRLVH